MQLKILVIARHRKREHTERLTSSNLQSVEAAKSAARAIARRKEMMVSIEQIGFLFQIVRIFCPWEVAEKEEDEKDIKIGWLLMHHTHQSKSVAIPLWKCVGSAKMRQSWCWLRIVDSCCVADDTTGFSMKCGEYCILRNVYESRAAIMASCFRYISSLLDQKTSGIFAVCVNKIAIREKEQIWRIRWHVCDTQNTKAHFRMIDLDSSMCTLSDFPLMPCEQYWRVSWRKAAGFH